MNCYQQVWQTCWNFGLIVLWVHISTDNLDKPILLGCWRAQALRWSNPSHPPGSLSDSNGAGSSTDQAKRQVSITLPDASYQPAAMAVLEELYIAKPWLNRLKGLTFQQQVQAAVLADMWQLPQASEVAVELLQDAADSTDNADQLSAVLGDLLILPAMPDCLLPLFEQALLSMYCNLEAVWSQAGGALQGSLLRLPLHAMELLLASNKLKVSGWAWLHNARMMFALETATSQAAASWLFGGQPACRHAA